MPGELAGERPLVLELRPHGSRERSRGRGVRQGQARSGGQHGFVHLHPLPEPSLSAGCSPFAFAELFAWADESSSSAHSPSDSTWTGSSMLQDQTPARAWLPLRRTPPPSIASCTVQGPVFSREPLLELCGAWGGQEGTGHPGFSPHRRREHFSLPSPRSPGSSPKPGAD